MNEQHLKTVLREVASRPHHALLICASQSHLDATRRQLEAMAIPMEVDPRTRNLTASIRTMEGKVSTLEMMAIPNDRVRAEFALEGRHPSQVFTDEMMEMSLAQYAAIMERFPVDRSGEQTTKGGDMKTTN
jgi:hypothetical protein